MLPAGWVPGAEAGAGAGAGEGAGALAAGLAPWLEPAGGFLSSIHRFDFLW